MKSKLLIITVLFVFLTMTVSGCGGLTDQTSETTKPDEQQSTSASNTDSSVQLSDAQIAELNKPADTSAIKRKYLDVSYATVSEAQKLDIYLPDEGEGPFPVIFIIHGGALMMGDKGGQYDLGPALEGLKRGYAVVSINYRLLPEAEFPAAVCDTKAALKFIKANASEYKLDKDKIAAWGASAGGYLATMLGTSSGVKDLQDDSLGNANQSDMLQAVVDWCGPMTIPTMADEAKQAANPVTYVTKDDPPFFIQHGTADVIAPMQETVDLVTKLESVIGKDKVYFEKLEGAEHIDKMFATSENVKKVLDFLDKYLK